MYNHDIHQPTILVCKMVESNNETQTERRRMGRPVISTRQNHTWAFYIPESFEDMWNKLDTLSKKDFNDEFKAYCREIEGVPDLRQKQQGIKGLYVRWILAKHVRKNLSKL